MTSNHTPLPHTGIIESKERGPRNGQPNPPWLFKGWLVKKAI